MQTATLAETKSPPQPLAPADSELIKSATPVLETILKIRAGALSPSPELRNNIKEYLRQMQQRSQGRERLVQAGMFALGAFVDETVLMTDFPLRSEWIRYPLQLELFNTNQSGVEFYDRLSELLVESESRPELLEIVEVYYICLILGFRGKYFVEDERRKVIGVVAEKLRQTGRLRESILSPHWQVNDQPALRVEPGLPNWIKMAGGVWLWVVVLLLILTSFLLSVQLNTAKATLLR